MSSCGWVWEIVDVFGAGIPVYHGVDCISDCHVVESLEINGGKLLVIGSDVSPVFSTVVSIEVDAVNISDAIKGVLLSLEVDEATNSFEEDVARGILLDRVCPLGKDERADVVIAVILLFSDFLVVSVPGVRYF